MTLYETLGKTFKLKCKGDEDFDAFAVRAAKHVNTVDDEDWKALPAELQEWVNETLKTHDRNEFHEKNKEELEALPELEGFPHEEEEATEEDGEEEVDEKEDADDEEASETEEAEGDDTQEETTEEADSTDESGDEESSSEDTETEPVEASDDQETDEPKRYKPETGKKKGKPVKEAKKTKPEPAKKAAKTAKPAKAAKAAKKVNGVRAGSFDPKSKIKVLDKENPHREGTGRYKRWSKFKNNMTVSEALKAGFNTGDLRHSVEDGHIKIEA